MTRAVISFPPESIAQARAAPRDGARTWRLSASDRFAQLRRTRYRADAGPLWVAWIPPAGEPLVPPRVAFAIGKRVGGAVVRNRLRRRLRAALVSAGPGPGDYLVGAGPEAADLPFSELRDLVSQALQAIKSSTPRPVVR